MMSADKLPTTSPSLELARRLASDGDRVFTTARARELAPAAGLSRGYLLQALHHLARAGWIVRLRKGLYALSSGVPGATPAHEFEIAMHLVEPAAISHWSAMLHHGLTLQIPRTVFVTTTASPPRRRGGPTRTREEGYPAGPAVYRFVQIKPERFFGLEKAWVGEARVAFTDPERTLLDGLSRPQYCGDFAEVLQAFRVRGDALDPARIVAYALRLDAATAKRLGWVLERQGVEPALLEPLETRAIRGYRPLDPTGPRRGRCCRRWMIQENLPGEVAG